MWDLLIVDPLTNLLLFLYQVLGNQTMIAVAVLTLLVRLAITPLTLNQQKTARKQQELQPKIQALQEKYKNDRDRLGQEQLKLYQEAGISPLGGCLPLLIQLPLMFALYGAIIRALASTPLQLLDLASHIYRWIPGLSTLAPLQSKFLWMDLALRDPLFIMPILVVATSWFQQKLLTPATSASADPQAQQMTQSMQITMPLIMGFFSMQYAAGLSVYFVISNLIGILQYYLFRQHYAGAPAANSDEKPATRANAAKGKPKS
ncbi:MAG: membrane protein insertase YidC [Anaerolineae bacterium]|nr:membrane protein insertase YidC [Anaerolineae bacterium]